MRAAYHYSYTRYQEMLGNGIAREVARAVLPVGLYSSMYATCNARSLMHFLSLRTTHHQAAVPSFPQREIEMVASGEYDSQDNPLRNAPHTASMLLEADWKHPYERAEAAYPMAGDRRAKYWPPVRRIDQAYGDRNLVCACPPAEAFAE